MLIKRIKKLGIKVDYPDYESSLLESLLSRGDRQLSPVIYEAWKNGAKFDAWHECFDYSIWEKAITICSIDLNFYTNRQRDGNEVFPWEHINAGITKEFLLMEYKRSKKYEISLDCNEKCLACGIQSQFHIKCDDLRSGMT